MNRSEINAAYRAALACFERHHWHLPPSPRWDITDFGLGDFPRAGLTLINAQTARPAATFSVPVDGRVRAVTSGEIIRLAAGSRVTLVPGVWHAFWPTSEECSIGEVSTANDDLHDNFFLEPRIGRFPGIDEDEPALVTLVSESA